VGLSFTEAGPPELFWLPGVPVSGVRVPGVPVFGVRSPGLRSWFVVILGFPESRSPELYGRTPLEQMGLFLLAYFYYITEKNKNLP